MPNQVNPLDFRERRKQVRLRLRADVQIIPQSFGGRMTYAVKDPVGLKHFAFSEREYFLLRQLDGTHTLEEIQKIFEQEFRPARMTLEDLEAFAQNLLKENLATIDSPRLGQQLFERRGKRLLREWTQVLTNVLFIRLRLFDPDLLLTHLHRWVGWLFAPWCLVMGATFILSAALFVGIHFTAFRSKLPEAHEFFTFKVVVSLWIAVGLVKVLHELGHGLACKAAGGEVHEAGVLLLCLSPSMYCDVSDAWKLPGKWRRVMIGAAGIYVELLIAAAAVFMWWHAPGDAFLNRLCLSLIIVCSVSTVLFNANPLLRFDGYYVFAELIEVPDLRERATRYFQRLVMEQALGAEPAPEPFTPLSRRLLFAAYAAASFLYSWTVTFGMLWFLYQFLRPYRLGTVGALLAAAAFGLMVGRPLFQLGRYLYRRGQLPEMTPRARITMAFAAVAIVAFFTLPLPISRVREIGVVQVQPGSIDHVFVVVPGILTRLHVRDGQHVEAGDILAEFESLEVDRQFEEARSEFDIRTVQEQVITTQAAVTTDVQKRGKLEVELAAATGERKLYAAQAEAYEDMRRRLVLRAPRSGTVLSPPKKDDVGKHYEKDQPTPFCSVADPGQLQVLVPVTAPDFRLLKNDLTDSGLAALVRVKGRLSATWDGRVDRLPESEAKDVPLPLTQKAGGPLAVKAGGKPGAYAPQEQHFLVTVNIDASDPGIRPGNIAQVKIRCRWCTPAAWVWRKVSGTFDLGLI
jgi:putative peptide zinc metalloprotease protein